MSASKSTTTQQDEFAAPAEVSGFDYDAAKGHLLVIVVKGLEEKVKTSFGDNDAIRADIHDISAKESVEDALIFPKVLVSSLKNRVGQKVLAKLGQGIAKPGQSAPWVLEDATGNPKAVAAAKAYLADVKPAAKAEPKPAEAEVEAWADDEDGDDAPPF